MDACELTRGGPEHEIQVSGLFVQPIADRLRAFSLEGKLDEDDLERALSSDARALLDHSLAATDWVPIQDAEGLVELVAAQLGGEAGLVEWAAEIVQGWTETGDIDGLLETARSLIDAEGFVVSQASALLVREPDWSYEGGRSSFTVRVAGMASAGPAVKALFGSLLARLALHVSVADFDVRVDGIDARELVVFGEADGEGDSLGEGRLHRAALIP